VSLLEDIILGEEFQAVQNMFLDKYCGTVSFFKKNLFFSE
jgi:hypothetical protein